MNEMMKNMENTRKTMTLTDALEIVLIYEDDKSIEKEAEEAMEMLKSRMEMSEDQIRLFAAIIESSGSNAATTEDLSSRLHISNIHFIGMKPDLRMLVSRRLIKEVLNPFKGISYTVPDRVLKAIGNDMVPPAENFSGHSTDLMLKKMANLFKLFMKNKITFESMSDDVFEYLNANQGNGFVKAYTALGIDEMDEDEQLIVLMMASRRVMFGETEMSVSLCTELLEDNNPLFDIFPYQTGMSNLHRKGILDMASKEGIADGSLICFRESAGASLFADSEAKKLDNGGPGSVRRSSDITPKKLFYNTDVSGRVDELAGLLSGERYHGVIDRLKEKGLRCGFSILFYGDAGTGKTETVYQLARRSGRYIFMVDASDVKSKWVGGSEKNIRMVFDRYRAAVRNSEVCPILLFNEADGVFGIRKKYAENAVDKMENSVQNIILQEMENLEGIMIATTNLTDNLDPAFERRFLYKLRFSRPDRNVRRDIWREMYSSLSEEDAYRISEWDLSGGQIENIVRKINIEYILSGNVPSVEEILRKCGEERISSDAPGKRRIGFPVKSA